METDKLEAFSDGCIAIFITIILLTFHAPDGGTYRDLLAFVPSLLCYLMSFIVIAIYWGNHHHLLHVIKNVNGKVMWANHALLYAAGAIVSLWLPWVALAMYFIVNVIWLVPDRRISRALDARPE